MAVTDVQKMVISVVLIVVVLALGILGSYSPSGYILTLLCAGALGGIVHEIAQSKGSFILPGPKTPGGSDYNLGSLMGIVLGAAAAALTLGSFSGLTISAAVAAFTAGAALKGIADAPS